MATYNEIEHENEEIFNQVIKASSLGESKISIKILANNSLKEIGKPIKANDLVTHMTSIDIVIVINEVIFDKLEEQQKLIVAETLIAGIHCSLESGKITIEKPDMCVYTGVINKYTFPICERVHETIKTLFEHEKKKKDGEIDPDSEPDLKVNDSNDSEVF
jgi:hypothetical protein